MHLDKSSTQPFSEHAGAPAACKEMRTTEQETPKAVDTKFDIDVDLDTDADADADMEVDTDLYTATKPRKSQQCMTNVSVSPTACTASNNLNASAASVALATCTGCEMLEASHTAHCDVDVTPTNTSSSVVSRELSQQRQALHLDAQKKPLSYQLEDRLIHRCTGCGQSIIDQYFLTAVEGTWHLNCLRCSQCDRPLHNDLTCFWKQGRIFCRADYMSKFWAKRCAGCAQRIDSDQLVMRATAGLLYHLSCFCCCQCERPLRTGDTFASLNGRVYCRDDYHVHVLRSRQQPATDVSALPHTQVHRELIAHSTQSHYPHQFHHLHNSYHPDHFDYPDHSDHPYHPGHSAHSTNLQRAPPSPHSLHSIPTTLPQNRSAKRPRPASTTSRSPNRLKHSAASKSPDPHCRSSLLSEASPVHFHQQTSHEAATPVLASNDQSHSAGARPVSPHSIQSNDNEQQLNRKSDLADAEPSSQISNAPLASPSPSPTLLVCTTAPDCQPSLLAVTPVLSQPATRPPQESKQQSELKEPNQPNESNEPGQLSDRRERESGPSGNTSSMSLNLGLGLSPGADCSPLVNVNASAKTADLSQQASGALGSFNGSVHRDDRANSSSVHPMAVAKAAVNSNPNLALSSASASASASSAVQFDEHFIVQSFGPPRIAHVAGHFSSATVTGSNLRSTPLAHIAVPTDGCPIGRCADRDAFGIDVDMDVDSFIERSCFPISVAPIAAADSTVPVVFGADQLDASCLTPPPFSLHLPSAASATPVFYRQHAAWGTSLSASPAVGSTTGLRESHKAGGADLMLARGEMPLETFPFGGGSGGSRFRSQGHGKNSRATSVHVVCAPGAPSTGGASLAMDAIGGLGRNDCEGSGSGSGSSSAQRNGSDTDLAFASNGKQKRQRTCFQQQQLDKLRDYFSANPAPDAQQLQQLSDSVHLPKRVLQVWFQNSRAKLRRQGVRISKRPSTNSNSNNTSLDATDTDSHCGDGDGDGDGDGEGSDTGDGDDVGLSVGAVGSISGIPGMGNVGSADRVTTSDILPTAVLWGGGGGGSTVGCDIPNSANFGNDGRPIVRNHLRSRAHGFSSSTPSPLFALRENS